MTVKELRQANNVKVETMCELLGVNRFTYYKKEIGAVRFSLTEAKKIADYFGKSIEDIFFAQQVSKIETA